MAANLELDPAAALVGAARLAVLADRLSAAAATVHDTAVDEFASPSGVLARRDDVAARLGRRCADVALVAVRTRGHAEAVGAHDRLVAEEARRLEAGLAAHRR
ncbi:MAG TPA: hypothetical protein VNP03_12010 [Pseudonocardia sp.]|nr:hypothetical protein [Pseudonocardia sp.]